MRLEAAATTQTPLPVWALAAPETPMDLGIEWDAENRLAAVKQGAATLASFTYAGVGRRASKTAGGVTTTYVYGGAEFLEERPSAGSTKRYVYGPGIDQPLAQIVGGTATYNVADHLGSIVRTSDTGGNPTLTREYDPWGNALQGSATSGYAFTGREWDGEAGLYYYRARYYDPSLGRFASEDPLGLIAGPNVYVYVGNSPVNLTDPSGEAVVDNQSRTTIWIKPEVGDEPAPVPPGSAADADGIYQNPLGTKQFAAGRCDVVLKIAGQTVKGIAIGANMIVRENGNSLFYSYMGVGAMLFNAVYPDTGWHDEEWMKSVGWKLPPWGAPKNCDCQ